VDFYFSEPLVNEGYLILNDEQILKCFKPVLDHLVEIVESQRAEIKRKGGALKVTTTLFAASLHFLTRDRQLSYLENLRTRSIFAIASSRHSRPVR
jgi:hypothetical protein